MTNPIFAAKVAPLRYEPSYETLEEDEAKTIEELAQTLLKISDTTFNDSGQGLRSVHAKSHALLSAELQVLDLPPELAQGLFAEPKTYSAVIRISTSPGDVLDDSVSTPRGLSMKVVGVEGDHLPRQGATLATSAPSTPSTPSTQDFLLVNGPAFLAPTAKKFLGNLKLLASTTDKIPNLKKAFSAVLRGAETTVEAFGSKSSTLIGLGGHPKTNPLGETYFSQVPFLYGPYMAKWSIAPIAPSLTALKDAPVNLDGKPNGLRDAMNTYFSTHGGEWELRVQLCTDLTSMPIEDASVAWPEDQSPFVTVARVTVKPQIAWSEEKSIQMDDGLAFSPWQGLTAHRPLGSINRARKIAYPSSSAARSSRGRCPVHEPNNADD